MPCRLRRITVYETTGRFYIVGCDTTGTKYNVLKIDRVDAKSLLTGEPETDYTREEILELLATISEGSSVVYRSSISKKGTKGGLVERVSNAYGILGVVRFLEGFYLLVINKANPIANLGYHTIYKIAEVAMIALSMDGVSTSSEEQRYVRLFQSVDLSTDFYFSYTYDLSRSLQENVVRSNWEKNGDRKFEADSKFVWNTYLLDPLRKNLVSERWFIEIVHGYVRQEFISLPVARLSLMVVGRRSAQFAGTRFLKRGANLHGQVANFVETEQIVWDMTSSPNFLRGRFSSFVQIRGSAPLRWSQDPSTRGVVGKPLILIDIHEPHAQTAASHFRSLRNKYGNPIVVMNLVKLKEKRRHEAILHDQLLKAVNYLNQFVPNEEKLVYLSFDVARCNKAASKSESPNVLTVLDEIAAKAVFKQGWFQTFPMPNSNRVLPRPAFDSLSVSESPDGRFLLQRGICRVNCVDCLDRTNVVQFGIAKVALAAQLCAMGLLEEPVLSLQSEVCRLLEDLFDEHGDTMALQYAGSQLVHSIKTYKKTAVFQERRRDVIQTLSRYYSNTFADYDKQAAINLFLGVFRPRVSCEKHLWELFNDYFLHFPPTLKIKTDYCAWTLSEGQLEAITFLEEGFEFVGMDEVSKEEKQDSREAYMSLRCTSLEDFRDYYRTYEFTAMDPKIRKLQAVEQRAIQVDGINQEASAQAQFLKLWKTPETKEKEVHGKKTRKEEKESDEEDDEEFLGSSTAWTDVLGIEKTWIALTNGHGNVNMTPARREKSPKLTASSLKKGPGTALGVGLQFAKDLYNLSNSQTTPGQRQLYEQYVGSGFICDREDWEKFKPTLLSELKWNLNEPEPPRRQPFFPADDIFRIEMPEVPESSISFYERSCSGGEHKLSDATSRIFSLYPNLSHS
ncbi:unnamed protein product [Caenorhabditis auriculariae]|uniref:SAC domain-containing protein n=1 Tax=Caenorhabditis auriculariae TaxID=2777116 RepID=A0A8S1GS93_9PELO|nr:unnamed protein product [Caenorhabditis auriculariae]